MISTLRHTKAHLSALVERASRGEEVVITVRGKPKARLCAVPAPGPRAQADAKRWGMKLKEARVTYSARSGDSSGAILDELRGERS